MSGVGALTVAILVVQSTDYGIILSISALGLCSRSLLWVSALGLCSGSILCRTAIVIAAVGA